MTAYTYLEALGDEGPVDAFVEGNHEAVHAVLPAVLIAKPAQPQHNTCIQPPHSILHPYRPLSPFTTDMKLLAEVDEDHEVVAADLWPCRRMGLLARVQREESLPTLLSSSMVGLLGVSILVFRQTH